MSSGMDQHTGADGLWKTAQADSFEADRHLQNFTLLCGHHGTKGPKGETLPALVNWLTKDHPVCEFCVRDGIVPDPRLAPTPQPMAENVKQAEDYIQATLEAENEREALRRERIDLAIARRDVAQLKALGAGHAAFKEIGAGAAYVADAGGDARAGASVALPARPAVRLGAAPGSGDPAPLEAIRRTPVGTSGPPPLPPTRHLDPHAGDSDWRADLEAAPAVPLRPHVADVGAETLEGAFDHFVHSVLGDPP